MTEKSRGDLPFVDAHDVVLPVAIDSAWERLTRLVTRSSMLGPKGFPDRELSAPTCLRLAGGHLFATYELRFDLEAISATETRVSATTHAKFMPGPGRVYRAFVIGSGAHAVIMRRFLKTLRSPS